MLESKKFKILLITIIMKKIYILLVFSILIVLTGCAPNIQDAKKLGFESVEQMEAFKARGYKSMSDYAKVKEMTPDFFYENCKIKSSDHYEKNCLGKKISWHGEIVKIGPSIVEVLILNDDLSAIKNVFSIDSKSLREKISESDLNKAIEFDGLIDKKNIVKPDVEKIKLVKMESDSDKNARIERMASEKKRKQEEEFAKFGKDSAWLENKYGTKGALSCASYADDYLRKVAKYSFRWDDIGFFGFKFNSYLKTVSEPGVITYVSNRASLQNGFGAFVRIELLCDYDTQKDKVLRYDFRQ